MTTQPILKPRGWLIAGGTETLVGLFAIATVLGDTLDEPGDNAAHNALLYLSGLLVVAGFLTIAATLVAMVNARGHETTAQSIDKVSVQVGQNGHLSKQLLAARTVDLVEMRDQIEAVARELTRNAIDDLKKDSSATYESLQAEIKQLRVSLAHSYVDSLGEHPPTLRVVPSPRP